MQITTARRILGVSADTDINDIKKSYRKLMHQVHPDTGSEADYPYTVQEINEAYALLVKSGCRASGGASGKRTSGSGSGSAGTASRKKAAEKNASGGSASGKKASMWKAPLAPMAFSSRQIFQYAEGADGECLGRFPVASGKYLWTPEEEFSLFLYSLFQLSLDLLSEAGKEDQAAALQPELCYLLAQQFTDCTTLLKAFASVEKPEVVSGAGNGVRGGESLYSHTEKNNASSETDDPVYTLSAMLEFASSHALSVKPGTLLAPGPVSGHRLRILNQKGKDIGYMSFPDDKLYYVVVPLFEQKRVRVQITAGDLVRFRNRRCQKLTLRLKLMSGDFSDLPEDLNGRIREILN